VSSLLGRGALFLLVLATLMVPFQALLTPLYSVLLRARAGVGRRQVSAPRLPSHPYSS
jgi:ABC-type glycerol-3-phosphate transport system permease component